jgi:hypothetical protein
MNKRLKKYLCTQIVILDRTEDTIPLEKDFDKQSDFNCMESMTGREGSTCLVIYAYSRSCLAAWETPTPHLMASLEPLPHTVSATHQEQPARSNPLSTSIISIPLYKALLQCCASVRPDTGRTSSITSLGRSGPLVYTIVDYHLLDSDDCSGLFSSSALPAIY